MESGLPTLSLNFLIKGLSTLGLISKWDLIIKKKISKWDFKLLTIYGVSLFGQSDFVIGHETLYVNHLKWE